MREKLKGLLKRLNLQMLGIYLAVIVGGSALLGFVVQLVITNIDAVLLGLPLNFDLMLLFSPTTWGTGFLVVAVFFSVVWIGGGHMGGGERYRNGGRKTW